MKESDDEKYAVALHYDQETVPKVVASGSGYLADKIIELANENGIELYQDKDLVGLLSQLEVGENIPNELFNSVAVVLAYVYQLNKK